MITCSTTHCCAVYKKRLQFKMYVAISFTNKPATKCQSLKTTLDDSILKIQKPVTSHGVNFLPLLIGYLSFYHYIIGTGFPVALQYKVTFWPSLVVILWGYVAISGLSVISTVFVQAWLQKNNHIYVHVMAIFFQIYLTVLALSVVYFTADN